MFRRRFIFVTAGLLILLLVVAMFTLKPSSSIQRWRSSRSLDAARAALAQNQPEKAVLAARRALQLNDHNRGAQEILAEFAGKSSAANELEWRWQILRQNPTDPDAIATFSLAAVRAGDTGRATEVLGRWPKDKHDIRFCRAAAAIALANKKYREALDLYQEAIQFPQAKPSDQLSFAALAAFSTSPAERDEGLTLLEGLKSDPEVGPGARRALIFSAMGRKEFETAKSQLDGWLSGGLTDTNLLLGLDVYSQIDQKRFSELVQQGFATFKKDSNVCGQIIEWLNQHGESDLAVEYSKAVDPETRSNVSFKFNYGDALDWIGGWPELLDLTFNETWGDVDCFRVALRARAKQKLSHTQQAEVDMAWKQCLSLAGQNQRALWTLVAFARRWSWEPQKEETLWAIARCPRGQERAVEDLEALYRGRQDSSGLFRIVHRTLELKPNNQQAAGRYALLGLLLGINRDFFAEFARKNWEDSSNRTPEMAAAYAYSLLLKGKKEDAAAVLQTLDETDLKSQALYAGLVNAANSNHDTARNYFQIAAAKSDLLPEEQALLRGAVDPAQ
jgi:Flp pilus assembly protein TadD